MPLKAMSDALGLPDVVNRACNPCWIFAESVNWLGVTALLVYRSTWLRDTDAMYAPIADMLARAAVIEVIVRGIVEDEGLIFGHGECVVYMLYSSEVTALPADPRVTEAIDILRSWGTPVHPLLVMDKMSERLAASLGTTI